jgi:hypothetical protein
MASFYAAINSKPQPTFLGIIEGGAPMKTTRQKVFLVVALIGLLYFGLLCIPNLRGAQTEGMLAKTSIDEPVTYPYVVRMLTPAHSPKELFERWVIYGDYHYGYPFYFLSALVVLPVRLAYGGLFVNHTGLNLFLLRQLISVLPMMVACILVVYLFTAFRSAWQTLVLLAVLLSTRGIVRSEIQWWHPDALSVLAVVLTLFFLNYDRLRFGRNFYFAAVACGVAAIIKLAGLFFFLAVGGYLAAGLVRKVLTLRKTLLAGLLFLGIMLAAMVVSNPVLYNAGARQEMVKIQIYKSGELDKGYTHDDPYYYSKGPQFWEWTLTRWFGNPWMLGFALLSLLAGCFWGPNRLLNRLILAWILPYSVYLGWFVAVKPDQYWLPVIVPLYGGLLNLVQIIKESPAPLWLRQPRLQLGVTAAVLLILAGFVVTNFARPASGITAQYGAALMVEKNLK